MFLFAGVVSASDADTLQPASTVYYGEDIEVDGTGIFKSIKIGEQGIGGVTFFQGTIINTTTSEGDYNNPVTFGDSVRIDDKIYRMEEGGPNPLKIADTIIPASTHDLGTSGNRWNKLYAKDGNFSGNLQVNGVSGLKDYDIPNDITVSNYLQLSGGTITGKLNVNEFEGPNGIELPVAIGYCNTGGTTIRGSDNFTACNWDDIAKRYNITLEGEYYENQEYITTVTPIGTDRVCSASSGYGKLLVYCHNTFISNGLKSDFVFTTYKLP